MSLRGKDSTGGEHASRPVFLIGFMAAGKTTLGQAVAAMSGRPFADTDRLVENLAGMSIPQIFAEHGEEEFRRLETRVLETIASRDDAPVVACGGGLPCRRENLDIMLGCGTVVWLQAPEDILVRRLLMAPGTRPLVDGKSETELAAYVSETARRRTPSYSQADARFDSSRLETAEEIRQSATSFITQFLN